MQQEADDKLVVANTHLLFNPRRGDIKLAQLMILMAEIDRHARLNPIPQDGLPCHHSSYCPVILTGDFNMLPHSPLYNFVVSGRMDYEGQLARHISGQEEGRYGGNNYYLHRNFFSPMYGVTETCQYHTAISSRLQQGDKPRQGRQGKQQVVSDRTGGEQRENWRHQEHHEEAAVNTGCISHGLNLLSAYRHNIERLGSEQEVTTHHKRAHCSVDYIFYSIAHREVQWRRDQVKLSRVRDGRLSLLARYGLMSARELDHMGGLPNHLLPSDHLCLITKFLLKWQNVIVSVHHFKVLIGVYGAWSSVSHCKVPVEVREHYQLCLITKLLLIWLSMSPVSHSKVPAEMTVLFRRETSS